MTNATTQKPCTKCEALKNLDEFYVQKATKDGRTSACKQCLLKQALESRVLQRYGLLPDQLQLLLKLQDNSCAICNRTFEGRGPAKSPHVDHCHASDVVRGLLCFSCNTGLGDFDDNPVWFQAAIDYLGRPPFRQVGADPAPCTPRTELGRRRLKAYGITDWQLERLMEIQGEGCAVCRKDFGDGKVCVDHDHATGEVRGLLCSQHNLAISRLGDSVERLRSAIAYLADPPAHGQVRLVERAARPTKKDQIKRRAAQNASRFIGVHWDAKNSRWMGEVRGEGAHFFLGRFDDERQAAAAVDVKLRELGRVRVNFPREGELPATTEPAGEAPEITEAPRKGRRPNRNNRSGFKGVSLQANGRFQAWIVHEKVRYHLGTFLTAEEAARAWNAKAMKLRGPDCWLNPV